MYRHLANGQQQLFNSSRVSVKSNEMCRQHHHASKIRILTSGLQPGKRNLAQLQQ